MRVERSFLCLLALAISGCLASSGAAPAAADSSEPTIAPPPQVDETTGSIAGTVVDDALQPVPRAQVGGIGQSWSTTTDASGAFTFNEVTPGTYSVAAQALGFESSAQKVTVEAGKVAEARFTLKSLAAATPYHETVQRHGFWTVAVDTLVAVPNTGVANDEHRFQFDAAKNWNTTIVELTFTFSNVAASSTPGAWFNTAVTPKGGSSTTMPEVFGKKSPVRAVVHTGQQYVGADGKAVGKPWPDGQYHHSSYAFPVGLGSDETSVVTESANLGHSRGFGAAISQKFDVYASIFYYEAAPDSFTGIPDQ